MSDLFIVICMIIFMIWLAEKVPFIGKVAYAIILTVGGFFSLIVLSILLAHCGVKL